MVELHKLPNENEEQFLWRLGQAKDAGALDMDWDELATVINKECRDDEEEYRTGCAYRKPYSAAKRFYDAGVFSKISDEAHIEALKIEQRELKKERQKLRDERSEYSRLLREQARRESFIELVKEAMSTSVEPLEYAEKSDIIETDNDMIICLSDLHAGMEVNSTFNRFNTSILRDRLCQYIEEIIDIQKSNQCKECYLVLGGDLISGLIHSQIRIENNENVIEQVKIVSVLLGDFVKALLDKFEKIHIYSVSGNHSRLSPEKENQLKGEELDALIPFYLELMYSNCNNVIVHKNEIDDTIISFRTRGGKLFYGVHGDKDNISTVVKNLTLFTGIKPDAIIVGHRHHNALSTDSNVKVIQCGCVMGMDNFCVDHRISGRAEQCVVITNAISTVKCMYDIGLD